MQRRPDLDSTIDEALPYALSLPAWGGDEANRLRLLQHCQSAFAGLGGIQLHRAEGAHCITPTYRLLVQHLLDPSPAAVESLMRRGLDRLCGAIRAGRASEALPPIRMTTLDTWNPRLQDVDEF